MRHLISAPLLTLAIALSTQPATAAPTSASTPAPAPTAPLADLVSQVSIPYESFTLPNGLTVLVHTDRKAPVVAVSVWYGVGSKNEPKGKTGFAHLFEHLMFNGSENVPGDYFTPLQQVGATDFNGTTWFDRTNYYQTVPTAALDRVLMMESDRMGHLLGAVTQTVLDNQRSVVQNEKRQGDNQPYGLVEYEEFETLYPAGHPYHHSTIGSMGDLDSASLADVKGWFREHYGPNNAILVLAGDIDAATARAKVANWFGAIPAGPKVTPVSAPVPTLPAPIARTIKDQVATPRLYRFWAIPGLNNPDNLPLQVGAFVLGGLASSRLDDALVRGDQLAVSASASADIFAQAGQFVVHADLKPGQDPAKLGAALDAQIARLIKDGPTQDELQRAATVIAAGQIRALESVGGSGKAVTLAEGLLYNGDPAQYRKDLETIAKLTPEQVRAALAKWLTRPTFALTVEPGTRTAGGENRGGDTALPPSPAPLGTPAPTPAPSAATPGPDRSKLPEAGAESTLAFPAIERATLQNGIPVYFARRSAIPTVKVRISFDAGYAADPKDKLGVQSLLMRLMDQGTQTLDSSALASARERLGASISGFATADTTAFQLDALTVNLPPSLALLSDYVRRPALSPAELERVRGQQLTAISAELKSPGALASRVLYPALYGPAHPYGIAPSGTGAPATVQSLTRADLLSFHQSWFRPDKASIYVVGDTTLPQVVKLLDQAFGDWKAPATPAPVKNFAAEIPAPTPRILLIDRPASPQSLILAGEVIPAKGTDDTLTLRSANDVIGGNFLARLNMNLRESKGWSYGVHSMVNDRQDRLLFAVNAPVQTDKTGPSIAELQKELKAYFGPKGTTAEELAWSTAGSARELPGAFETSAAVLDGVVKIITYHRPDAYYQTLPSRYRAMTATGLDTAAKAAIDPAKLTWVVVGDRAKVEPQLKDLGLPVEVVPAPGQ